MGVKKKRSSSLLPQRALNDGFSHGLEPVLPLDLRRTETVGQMVEAMGRTAFAARQIGEAADLLVRIAQDKDCFVVCTLSGAMTVAKMGLVLCEMIDRRMVHAVVSTGALMTHGLVEGTGLTHFQYRNGLNDEQLFAAGYNRIHDTLELEKNLDEVEAFLDRCLESHSPRQPLSSWRILRLLGRALFRETKGRAILKSAYRRRVPVFVPAFTDCELGLDFAALNWKRRKAGKRPFAFDAFDDLDSYANLVRDKKRLAIFTIGGGVPRNWAQQVGPYLDLLERRVGSGSSGFRPFTYGIRICPDPPHWGHLSGCTYSEGISWGKFVPEHRGGRFVEVMLDATVAWPLIVKAACERLDAGKHLTGKASKVPAGAIFPRKMQGNSHFPSRNLKPSRRKSLS